LPRDEPEVWPRMSTEKHTDTEVALAVPPNELIVEILQEGIWTIDTAGLTTFVNARMAAMLGYEPSQMIGVELFGFMDDEGRAITEANLARRRQGIQEEHEFKLQRRDGSAVWTQMSVSPITGPNGEYGGAIALVTDITERRRAESALRESTARFEQLFESTTDAVGFFDVETLQVLDANEAALAMYGRSREQLSGLSIADITTRPDAARALAKRATPGSSWSSPQQWHRRADGTVFLAELTTGVFELENRSVGFAIVRDASSRFEAEEALRRERDHSRALIAAIQDGLVESDVEGVITEVNDQFCAMTGLARADLIGSGPPHVFWPPRLSGTYMGATADFLAGGEGTWDLKLRRASGETFPAVVAASAIRGADGEAVGYLGFFRDVTERRRAVAALHEAELEHQRYAADLERHRLELELARAQRLESLGRLAGGIAHDFTNQIGLILNYASFISTDVEVDSRIAADVAQIQQAAERAADLTRRLLLFGRREAMQSEVFDLNRLARETVDLVTRLFGRSIDVDIRVATESCWVDLDRTQLEQVLMNLLLNARDALTDGGTITVATTPADAAPGSTDLETGRYVQLTVSDDGIGMPPDVLARAFEPFFTTKPHDRGSGLGLATAYSVITGADGRIDIDSQRGIGTQVHVYLPGAAAPAVAEPRAGRGETVLVVDDEPDVRTMTGRILREGGYQVIEAETGTDALAHAQTPQLRLLLTDVVMPEMAGDELAARLVRDRPGLKTLFMSAHAPDIIRETLPGPLVEKPFTQETILEAVRQVLDEPATIPR
jgi:PAS domain S-box-containing protein